MKYLYFLALLPLLFAACDNSNEPEGKYKIEYYVSNRAGVKIQYYDPESKKGYIAIPTNGVFNETYHSNSIENIFMIVESVKENTDTLYSFVKINNELSGEFNGHLDSSESKLVYFWKD